MCVVAMVIDALVLARTTPHHSMNYRSAVVYGRAREVTDPGELVAAARAITRHVLPGREDDAAEPRDKDWLETLILAMPIAEASAKVRTGPPADDEADLALEVWAGTLPLHTVVGEPSPSPDLRAGIATPDYLQGYRRP
jgi:nitroimidazol reductase NimA-like FMN-containing flavoprotein (pyridoxamine 5'-phosphate oxidase superfamily)